MGVIKGDARSLDYGSHEAVIVNRISVWNRFTRSVLGMFYYFWGMGFLICVPNGSRCLPRVTWAKLTLNPKTLNPSV